VTSTEARLADALDVAARAIRDDTLHPLHFSERERRRPAWVAPVAAAASLLLVVGLAMAVSDHLRRSERPARPSSAAPPRYYVEEHVNGGRPAVRSTATGAVTATVPVPRTGFNTVAAERNGIFFVVAFVQGLAGERLYRFRLTGSGRVSGFSAVPGRLLGGSSWLADAIAVSPDGSRVAVAFTPEDMASCSSSPPVCTPSAGADYIVVVDVATGSQSVWRGGMVEQGSWFSIASLSWTGNGRELVFLGQRCGWRALNNETCDMSQKGRSSRTAELWALDPGSGGGRLSSGRLLFRQSARYPYIAQALISPDGSTITAVVQAGPVVAPTGPLMGSVPGVVSVDQISVATGKLRRVLYRRDYGITAGNLTLEWVGLTPDSTGQHWLLNVGLCDTHGCAAGSNGWIDQGRLVPLPPSDGVMAAEAW